MIVEAVALAAAAGALAPLAEARRRPVARLRGEADGVMIDTPGGATHLRRFGPARGPAALLIHGLTTPSYVWLPIARHLSACGHRVIAPDLWGRGLSDRPAGAQDAAFFLRQIEAVAEAEQAGGAMLVVGYSMGGAIATALADACPARVGRLVLLAPAGLGHDLGRFAAACARTPVLGDWAARVLGGAVWRRGIARGAPLHPDLPDLAQRQAAEADVRGSLPAWLAAQRGILSVDMAAAHRRIAAAGLPTLAVWGRQDRIIPLAAMGRLAEANRAAQQVVLEGAGHALPVSHAGAVCGALDAFLGAA
ncbi:MAG: alpha/beta fold hydrolase [Gemmobacter sp.]